MYFKHPMFSPPSDPNIKIWRYINLTKFLSVLDKSALFFASLDSLGDPFESLIPMKDMRVLISKGFHSQINDETERMTAIQNEFRALYKQNFANCWYMSQQESAAMWAQYSSHGEGKAIQSTFARLRDCFETSPDSANYPPVFIGTIHYINYNTESTFDTISNGGINSFRWLLHKRLSFQSEQELRALTVASGDDDSIARRGRYVSVNLKRLIENVYTSPESRSWQVELVRALIRKFDLEVPVLQSDLLQNPPY